ncbi:MAG: WbqC family protein, partial [Candidatus Hydrogenedentota bacterium]
DALPIWNKIKAGSETKWLTVPLRSGRAEKRIEEVEIDYGQPWQKKHLGALQEYYAKAPYYSAYIDDFAAILHTGFRTLSELNISLFQWVMDILLIETELVMSRDIGVSDASKVERPLLILEKMEATEYVLGAIAKPYTDEEAFRKAGIALEYKSYDYSSYPQLGESFIGEVSILDLIFNMGNESRGFLKSTSSNCSANSSAEEQD